MDSVTLWSTTPNPRKFLAGFKEIFYSCSGKKEFNSDEQKEKFFDTWTNQYFKKYSNHILLSIDQNDKLSGYLTGCPDSHSDKELKNQITSMAAFEEYYDDYPAHLHINCHPTTQGKGIGRNLIRKYIELLKKQKSKGVHIITAPDARNVGFYEKCGFKKIATKDWKETKLLMMGLSLDQ